MPVESPVSPLLTAYGDVADVVKVPKFTVVALVSEALVPHWNCIVCPELPFGSTVPFRVAEVPATDEAAIVTTSTGRVVFTVEVSVSVVEPQVPPAVVNEKVDAPEPMVTAPIFA